MLPVIWKGEAIVALDGIVDFIGENDPLAAVALADQIKHGAERLGDHPFIGREGRVRGTREWLPHPNYWLVYHVAATQLDILNVLHTRREYP